MGSLPVGLRPAWSSTSFLLYLGAFTVLVSLALLLGTLSDLHGSTALLGWSALFLTLMLVAAVASERAGRPVVAGLAAFVALIVFAVFLGSFFDAIGLADDVEPFDSDLELAPLLAEVTVLVAALVAARRFRFPLLLLAATVAKTVLVLDTVAGLFGTGNWIAVAALVLGLAELTGALSLDGGDRRAWAFWKHAAAAALIGGAVVWFLDGNDVGWVLIALVSLAYVALARSFGRSAWAVVGAIGLFLVTTHFVDESDAIVGLVFPFASEDFGGEQRLELWETALVYMGLGVVYVLLGQLLRQPTTHEPPPV
jgi:hypothetical protein